MNKKFLSEIKPGDKAIIKKVMNEGSIKRRLLDIGLIPGTKIECVLRSPSGDPYAYNIRGSIFALRNTDTEKILIEAI